MQIKLSESELTLQIPVPQSEAVRVALWTLVAIIVATLLAIGGYTFNLLANAKPILVAIGIVASLAFLFLTPYSTADDINRTVARGNWAIIRLGIAMVMMATLCGFAVTMFVYLCSIALAVVYLPYWGYVNLVILGFTQLVYWGLQVQMFYAKSSVKPD